MKYPYIVTLANGTTLYIEEDQVTYEPCVEEEKFTVSMQRVVRELARNLNHHVSYDKLYQVYDGRACEDKGRHLQRMRDKMPSVIKSAIKAKNNLGYKLIGTPVDIEARPQPSGGLGVLTGDYYSFFLDPLGSGAVLGGYIRIEEGEARAAELPVTAVLGVRSDGVLFGERIGEIFLAEPSERYARFRALHKDCSPNDRRFFWGEGKLRFVNTYAEMTLSTPKGAKWTLMLDLNKFLTGGRGRYPGEDGKYRGGKGIYVALATQYDTFAGKIGIIRTSFCKPQMSLKDSDLQELIQQTVTNGNIPLRVPSIEDNYWYNWFMSK